jgi:hypothetical protein
MCQDKSLPGKSNNARIRAPQCCSLTAQVHEGPVDCLSTDCPLVENSEGAVLTPIDKAVELHGAPISGDQAGAAARMGCLR